MMEFTDGQVTRAAIARQLTATLHIDAPELIDSVDPAYVEGWVDDVTKELVHTAMALRLFGATLRLSEKDAGSPTVTKALESIAQQHPHLLDRLRSLADAKRSPGERTRMHELIDGAFGGSDGAATRPRGPSFDLCLGIQPC